MMSSLLTCKTTEAAVYSIQEAVVNSKCAEEHTMLCTNGGTLLRLCERRAATDLSKLGERSASMIDSSQVQSSTKEKKGYARII